MVYCMQCGKPYSFITRWKEGAGLVKFGSQCCSHACYMEFSAFPDEEQNAKALNYLRALGGKLNRPLAH